MYFAYVEVQEKRIQEIFDRLDKAQEEIYKCYADLKELGIVKVVPADDEK